MLSAATNKQAIRVGVIQAMPFSGQMANGWQTQFYNAGSDIDVAMPKVKSGKYQVLIGPIEASQKHYAMSSFSRPVYISYVVLLSNRTQETFLTIFQDFLGVIFNKLFLIVLLVLIVLSLTTYLVQKRSKNNVKEEGSLLFQIWHIIVAFLTLNHFPQFRHFSSRIIYIMIIILSIATLTSFTATLTSALTHSYNHHLMELKVKQNLHHETVALVQGQLDTHYISQAGGKVVITQTMDEALKLLAEKKVTAIASYYPLIQYAINNPLYRGKFHVLPYSIGLKEIIIAFPKNSSLQSPTNVAIMKLRESLALYEKCLLHLPKSDAQSCAL
jgi:ABC-type amino acid transport substrate-binding protein